MPATVREAILRGDHDALVQERARTLLVQEMDAYYVQRGV